MDVANSGRVLRAWIGAHRARPAIAVATAIAFLMLAFASAPVPTWQAGTPLPLWALAPGTLALIVSTSTENQLAAFSATNHWSGVAARGAWAVAVTVISAILTWPIGILIQQQVIVVLTMALVATTFGLSPLLGKGCLIVGASVDFVAVSFGNRVDAEIYLRHTVGSPSGLWVSAFVVLAGIMAYAFVGHRRVGDARVGIA